MVKIILDLKMDDESLQSGLKKKNSFNSQIVHSGNISLMNLQFYLFYVSNSMKNILSPFHNVF